MNRTTVGVIGLGRIGRMHTENLVRAVPGAYVKAVASPHLDTAWAEALGVPVRTTDAGRVFGDREIDAVVVTASSDVHVDLIERAAAAGKHVFCEKPVAFDPERIDRAHAAAAAAGVKLQVGFNRRFDPGLVAMWENVRAGAIGDVHQIRVTNRDPKAPPVAFVRRSGGLFFDFAIHDFDTVRFLSGSDIVELFAAGAVLVDPAIGEAGDVDTAVISARLACGALAVIDCSRQTTYGYDQRFEVFGSEGSIFVDNTTATTMITSRKGGVVADTPHPTFVERYRDAFVAELAAFVACVRDDTPVRVGAADAASAVRAAVAAKASHESGRPVRVAEQPEPAVGGARR